jgi:response regulator RpfG family c-di-GMP phosphodiesterase
VQSIIAAINRGEIHRYITKPWEESDILLVVKQALERKYLFDEKMRLENLTKAQNEELKNLNASLEIKVQERTTALNIANEKLKENFLTSIKVFSSLIEMRDGKLAGHSRRVADLARRIAVKMGLSTNEIQDVFVAGLLVDIGKIGLTDELLNLSMNQMNSKQLGQYQQHPVRAEQILMPLENLQATAKILRAQQERVDGHGFPDRISGDAIPIAANILAIASDYDSFQTGTLVQRKLPQQEAQALIMRSAGRYHPKVMQAFEEALIQQHHELREYDEIVPKNLSVGMVLHADLVVRDGALLLPANCKLNENLIKKLIQYDESNGEKMIVKIKNGKSPTAQ